MPKYEFELWQRGEHRLGEIGRMMKNIKYKLVRNRVYTLDFGLDLTAFEEYCAAMNQAPRNVLEVGITDVRVKRNGKYIMGANVVDLPPSFGEDGASIQVSVDGFLSMFDYKFLSAEFKQIEATEIAWQAIALKQAEANGTFNVTKGAQYLTRKMRDRLYQDDDVKELLINLTDLVDGTFDFEFAADRSFNTYGMIGDDRPDVTVNYPAIGSKVTRDRIDIDAIRMGITRSSADLANRIIGKGSGFGDETIRHVANDPVSQQIFGVREKIVTFNNVTEKQTLIDHTEAELKKRAQILELPNFTVSGAQFDIEKIGLGSRIKVKQLRHPMYKLDGMYRIEQIDVSLDENFAEEVTITVDNIDL